ncbi:RNA-binding protein Jag [Sporosarcina sp. NCCP-2716]|uniref:RNA-binding cell elongation regulator Jag/EloR n=1 Tax=Sporosarcina sp. NCCP-2716 TaxID=2943679 RepID=UPI00203D5739|nr:RNA-binding cell elongation regulator Jag/EloR [Sporosarcina sp. NCCP-2716]GKV70556.1 RNA-binding protein Jag [Sporosarcina sp. NCCP-2716]
MSEIRQTGKSVDDAIASALEKLNAVREQVDVRVITRGKKGFLGFGAVPAEVAVTRLPEPDVQEPAEELNEELNEGLKKEPAAETPEMPEETAPAPADDETQPDIPAAVLQDDPAEEPAGPERSDEEIEAETTAYLQEVVQDMGVDDLSITCNLDGKVMDFQLDSEKAAFLIGKRGATLNALQQLAQLIANKGTGTYKVVRLDVGDYRKRREESLELLADRMADKAVRSGRKVELEPMPSNERKVLHNALADRLDIETYSEGKDPRRYLVIEPIK